MTVTAFVILAGVVGGPWLLLVRSQLVRSSLEDECYNVGSCTPLEEPKGGQQEICRIFEESLSCMKSAMEACRQLDFPPDTVHLALDGVRLLREELKTYCSDQHLDSSRAFADTAADVQGDKQAPWRSQRNRDGVPEHLLRVDSSTSSAIPFVDEEDMARSEQMQAEINSGNRLPFPAICTALVVSLHLASMSVVWVTALL